MSEKAVLRRLVAALDSEYKPSLSPKRLDEIGDALNAALVVVGIRSGARLDGSSYSRFKRRCVAWNKSVFLDTVHKEAKRKGIPLEILRSYEPLIFDSSKARPDDARLLADKYNDAEMRKRGDLTEPIVGAMGRVLGYGCRYPRSQLQRKRQRTGNVGLHAWLHGRRTNTLHRIRLPLRVR